MRLVPPKGLLIFSYQSAPSGLDLQLFVFYKTLQKRNCMKVTVNSKETEVLDGCTLAQLALSLELPERGVAVAVNNRMIPRTQWESYGLQPNDSLVVIKAACGG